VDVIVHAGDVGPQSILMRLENLAPVIAVRGNNDFDLPLKLVETTTLAGLRIVVAHTPPHLHRALRAAQGLASAAAQGLASAAAQGLASAATQGSTQAAAQEPAQAPSGAGALSLPVLGIHGHTHIPEFSVSDGVTIVCPGSASCPRGASGPSVMVLRLGAGVVLGQQLVEV